MTVLSRWRLSMAMVTLLGCLSICSGWGAAFAEAAEIEFGLERSFGFDGTELSGFSSATSVAVDHGSGNIYVLDRKADAIYKFDLEGNPVDFGGSSSDISGNKLSGLSIADSVNARQIAVDPASHILYVPGKDNMATELGGTVLQAFHANGEPALFSGAGTEGNEIPGFHGLVAVSVDDNGAIYTLEYGDKPPVEDFIPGGLKVFKSDGSLLVPSSAVSGDISAGQGLVVNTLGAVYAVHNLSALGRYTPSVFPVTSATTYSGPVELESKGSRAIGIEPGLSSRLFVGQQQTGSAVARIEVFDSEGESEGAFGEGKLVYPAGVDVEVTKEVTRVYVAQNPEGGLSQIKIFKEEVCECPPTIESVTAAAVTGDSAMLRAKINPGNLATTYWFEFGKEDCELVGCAKLPIGGGVIPKGRKGVNVSQLLSNLEPHTTYHYRVVAKNEKGEKASEDKTFTTQGSGLGFELTDSRAWEMVSPAQKFGGTLITSGEVPIQASISGNGLAYASLGSILKEPNSSHIPEPVNVLAQRNEDGSWVSRDLAPPHSEATKLRGDTEFNIFTPSLSKAEMEPTDGTPLSPEAIGQAPYLWTDGDPPLFSPLLTAANTPPGTDVGPEPGKTSNPVRIEGATSDLQHIVIRSENTALVSGAALRSIYMWGNGDLDAVSVPPGGEGKAVEAMLGSGRGSVKHAISSDGSRVFWAPFVPCACAEGLKALYLRDMQAGQSVRLDVKQPGASGAGPVNPAFAGASADGQVVYFIDSHRLVKGASPAGRDLYRCEIGEVGGALGCQSLTDISAPLAGSGESAEVLGLPAGVSEDSARIYFAARGVLGKEPNQEGISAKAGGPNLYLWEEGAGIRFIATLAENDYRVWGALGPLGTLGFGNFISASVSPDGRYLAFTSEQKFRTYDNESSDGSFNTEVFLYDAEASSDQLGCVSCNPSGAAAVGELLPGQVQFFPPDPIGMWKNRQVAATLPEAPQTEPEGRSLYRPRYVLDNGRVFFNSVDPLVPADSNGNWDVYQYQPVGVGSCTAQAEGAAVSRSGDGCVSLISSGTSDGDAGFLDATPSGNDVFFLTKGRLSVLDRDDQLDAYDARVDGIEAVLNPPQECAGEACQPSVGPPNDPTPASESFRGAQTPVPCRKGQRRVQRNGRTVCVQKKHKKHKKKRAGKKRGAGR